MQLSLASSLLSTRVVKSPDCGIENTRTKLSYLNLGPIMNSAQASPGNHARASTSRKFYVGPGGGGGSPGTSTTLQPGTGSPEQSTDNMPPLYETREVDWINLVFRLWLPMLLYSLRSLCIFALTFATHPLLWRSWQSLLYIVHGSIEHFFQYGVSSSNLRNPTRSGGLDFLPSHPC